MRYLKLAAMAALVCISSAGSVRNASGQEKEPAQEKKGLSQEEIDRLFAIKMDAYEGSQEAPNPAVMKMTFGQYLDTLDNLHPAFILTGETARQAVEYGVSQKKKKYGEVFDRWSKEVGGLKDRVSPFIPLSTFAYRGWDSAKTYKEIDWENVEAHVPSHFVSFLIQMERPRSPRELKGVKFVLATEDGKYHQPTKSPEATEIESSTETRYVTIPQTETQRGTGTVYGRGGFTNYSYKSTATYQRTYVRQKEWFSSSYTVVFDLLNPDGTARITNKMSTVELVIIMEGREKRAKFDLKDWTVESLPAAKKKGSS